MTRDDYNHGCDACFNAYMANPTREPCFNHKGKPGNTAAQTTQGAEENRREYGYTWGEGDKPFDFQATPKLLRRLEFLKYLWCPSRTPAPEVRH